MRRTAVPPRERAAALKRLQSLKMARSAHAYVRGSTKRFYEWQGEHRIDVAEGPPVWICGDCHSGNLGPLANADGDVAVLLRDFDQTIIGNPAWDLLRLLLSLASAARGMDLAGVTTVHLIEAGCAGYAQGLRRPTAAESPGEVLRPTLRVAARRAWKELARERLEGVAPALPIGRTYWPLSAQERDGIQLLFNSGGQSHLAHTVLGLEPETPVHLLDAAYWVKGCSSLGLLRIAALVAVGPIADAWRADPDSKRVWRALGKAWRQGAIRLVDFKQATAPLIPVDETAQMPGDNAQRVLAGANALAPYLGERMAAVRVNGTPGFVRELLPQDLKLEVEKMSPKAVVDLSLALARIVGAAHARQLSAADRRIWARQMGASRSKTLDAPSWVFAGVRDLMAVHEAAYLDHCRRFGLGQV